MKKKIIETMLVPGCVKQFHCLGGECPDTCCIGWDVAVDRQSLEKFRTVVDVAWQARLHEAVSGERGAMLICRGDSGQPCAMYSADGLCAIHRELGEDALPDICHNYPRTSYKFGERFEQSLSLSCPEAARLALDTEEAFAFSSIDLTVLPTMVGNVTPVAGFDLAAMDDVRTLVIQVLQTDGLTNADRLTILGLLCERLDRLAAESRQQEVGAVLSSLVSLVESGVLQAQVRDRRGEPVLSANIFAMLIGNLDGKGTSAWQREVLDWVRDGLGLKAAAPMPTAAALAESVQRGAAAMAPAAAVQDGILSRFLVNEAFRCVFPWGQGAPLLKSYRYLLLLFGCLRLMQLAVAAARGQAPDRPLLVRVTQVFCRVFAHDPQFSVRADRLLTGAAFDTPEKLFSLI